METSTLARLGTAQYNLTLKTNGHTIHNHSTGFGQTKFFDWDTFLQGPKVSTSVSRLLESFAQPSAKDQNRNNE